MLNFPTPSCLWCTREMSLLKFQIGIKEKYHINIFSFKLIPYQVTIPDTSLIVPPAPAFVLADGCVTCLTLI